MHMVYKNKICILSFTASTSCNHIYQTASLRGTSLSDGVYNVTIDGNTFPVYCDMTKDEGGWTLVLFGTTNRTSNQWNEDTVKRMNEHNPSIDTEYSILYRADSIKNQGIGNTFQVNCGSNIVSMQIDTV